MVLGGTSLLGGRGTFIGTLLGAVLLIVRCSTPSRSSASTQTWQYLFQGGLIVVAAVIYSRVRGSHRLPDGTKGSPCVQPASTVSPTSASRTSPPHAVGPRRGPRRGALVRHLRHRPPRVRGGSDRHADQPAPAHRGDPAPDPRARVLGTVVELGSDVTRRRRRRPGRDHAGDRLRPLLLLPRGPGSPVLVFACTGLSAETGGLAQYAVLKEYQVARLPDAVSDLEGAVIEPAGVAAYGIDRVGVSGGDIVLVTGAGPIGILSAMYADGRRRRSRRHRRAQPQPRSAGRRPRHRPGARPDRPRLRQRLLDLTEGSGVDLTAECSGTSPGLTTAISSTRRPGRWCRPGCTPSRPSRRDGPCRRRTSATSAAGAT